MMRYQGEAAKKEAAKNNRIRYDNLMCKNGTRLSKTFEFPGVNNLFFFEKNPNVLSSEVIQCTLDSDGTTCPTCIGRHRFLLGMIGPDGPVLYKGLKDTNFSVIDKMIELTERVNEKVNGRYSVSDDSKFILVANGTLPSVMYGTFSHPTVHVHQTDITPEPLAQRFLTLESSLINSEIIDNRLKKFLTPGAIDKITMIEQCVIPELIRKDHWRSVFTWVLGLIERFKSLGKETYESLTRREIRDMLIFAVMTGRYERTIHLDFQQSSNIVDFLDIPELNGIKGLMDSRSNPTTYMVSTVAEKLAKEGVKSSCTGTLEWDDISDLDIDCLTPDGERIYFSNKKGGGCTLDFDANAFSAPKEDGPYFENISFKPGNKYTIRVNNWHDRSKKNIIFTITFKEVGAEDIIINDVWPHSRQRNNFMEYTHTFGPGIAISEPISDKKVSKAHTNSSKWDSNFGRPTSMVATLESCDPGFSLWTHRLRRTFDQPLFMPNDQALIEATRAHDKFMSEICLVGQYQATICDDIQSPPKDFVSLLIDTEPGVFTGEITLGGLIEVLNNGQSHNLEVNHRAISPGYCTRLFTENAKVIRYGLSLNCYLEKFQFPRKPVNGDISNAKLDGSWFCSGVNLDRLEVLSIIRIGDSVFIVLNGATLSNSSEDFPLGGGFYPTNLRADFHHHRERWGCLHSTLKPTMSDTGTPLIGGFLLDSRMNFILDGMEIVVVMN